MNAAPLFFFDRRVSGDGILTFAGGLLAFLAIWRQVRHADRALRKRLEVKREAHDEERERQRQALRLALLAEIDVFEEQYVRVAQDAFEGWPPQTGDPLAVVVVDPPADMFPVYRTNAQPVGEFEAGVAECIVRFYGLAGAFISLTREAAKVQGQAFAGVQQVQNGVAARRALGHVRSSLPVLVKGTEAAESALEELPRQGTASAVPAQRSKGGRL